VTRYADVVIAGAGPAGSATAQYLARVGLRVLLLDRATFPRDKTCAEYLGPETLRHLDRLGVLAALDATGATALRGTTVRGSGGGQLTGLFAGAGHHPFRTTGLAVPRRRLDAALVAAAQRVGATLQERTVVEDLVLEAGRVAGVVVRCGDRHETIKCRLVVGADGLRSVVSRRLGTRRYGWPRRMALVAHAAGVDGMSDLAEMAVGREGYVGLNPLGHGVTNVALVLPASRLAGAGRDINRFFLERVAQYPGIGARVPAAGLLGPVRVTGPFAVSSQRLVADGALLTGDAAEFFDPFTGEGICTALRGASLAAAAAEEALYQSGAATARRLQPYLTARHQALAGKRIVERLIAWSMHAPRLFDRAVDRLERRGLAHLLIGVTANFVPPREVLHPRFLATLVL